MVEHIVSLHASLVLQDASGLLFCVAAHNHLDRLVLAEFLRLPLQHEQLLGDFTQHFCVLALQLVILLIQEVELALQLLDLHRLLCLLFLHAIHVVHQLHFSLGFDVVITFEFLVPLA